jgi:hypothetical protein
MTATAEELVSWIDERANAVLAAPPMWGSPEAVELQLLLLAELRAFIYDAAREGRAPRRVLESYAAYLRRRYPGRGDRPLHELVPGDSLEFVRDLKAFFQLIADDGLPEDPPNNTANAYGRGQWRLGERVVRGTPRGTDGTVKQ